VFCACEIMQLFSVVFCVVRTVHKFDIRRVINVKESYAVTETYVLTG
jgi:hypothetical protein